MATIIQGFEEYLQEALDVQVRAKLWKRAKELPFFFKEFYSFYETHLLRRTCILVVAKGEQEITPAVVQKHLKQLQTKWDGLCIYVREAISSYHRKRLIEHRVPFVIPGNQMYLPDIAVDLREHFQKLRSKRERLSPAGQAVVIYELIHGKKEGIVPSELAEKLNYTAMTMTRAFNELEALEIGKTFREGKERYLYFSEEKRELWDRVKPFMESPVKKKLWLPLARKEKKEIERLGVIAGLSALARNSMLTHPELPTYAIDKKTWQSLKHNEVPFSEEADIELEVWNYDPKLFAKNGLADPFSLYLSLQENQDERVEMALEKLMEKIEW